MSDDCIFCKIFRKEIPSDEVERTDHALVFRDLNPQAPTHLLVIPKRHAEHLSAFSAAAPSVEIGELFALAAKVGAEHAPGGYRVVSNIGVDGGQTVRHLHLHVLGGRHMGWPPG
ncbi:MAG: histidine triad nucleotide-binding protein [Vulcanimicrobiaceae bacterium]